jgi:hypothetical protein
MVWEKCCERGRSIANALASSQGLIERDRSAMIRSAMKSSLSETFRPALTLSSRLYGVAMPAPIRAQRVRHATIATTSRRLARHGRAECGGGRLSASANGTAAETSEGTSDRPNCASVAYTVCQDPRSHRGAMGDRDAVHRPTACRDSASKSSVRDID